MKNKILKWLFAWRFRLYNRTALLMLLLTALSLGLIGYILLWRVRNVLENQFSRNLTDISVVIASEIDAAQIQLIESLGKGNRTYENLQNQLLHFRSLTNLRRIFIFDSEWRSVLDTEPGVDTGHFYYDLYLDQDELEDFSRAKAVTSKLFQNEHGMLIKRAYTQLHYNHQTYYLGVEASTQALAAWKDIRSTTILFSIAIVLFGFISAYFFSKSITIPIRSLVNRTSEIQKGNLQQKIETQSQDEIGVLAQNMEKMRQSILRRNQQQQTVLAGIAHEVRNPLGGIEMFASIIENETKDESVKQYAQRIMKESQQIQKILREFNEFGNPITPDKQPCSLIDVLTEVQDLIQVKLNKRSLKLEIVNRNATPTVLFDPGHLRQVLVNLIDNAVQFSPQHAKITVQISCQNSNIYLDIIDSGPGIPLQDRETIFQPFHSTEKEHTGLGLAIVKNLVEENGAKIDILPSEKGAQVRLTFQENRELYERHNRTNC